MPNVKRLFKLSWRFIRDGKFRRRIMKNLNTGFDLAANPATDKTNVDVDPSLIEKLSGKKFGFIGGCELEYMRESLESILNIETYHTFEYGGATNPMLEVQSEASEIIKMKPDYLVISHLQQTRNYFRDIQFGKSSEQSQRMQLEEIQSTLSMTIDILRKKGITCPVFIVTIPIVYRPAFGRFEYNHIEDGFSLWEFMNKISITFYKVAKDHDDTYVLDLEQIFRNRGIEPYIRKTDANGIYEHITREGAVYMAERLLNDIQVIHGGGQQIKAIVVDLDNTLWDGIIRDDGINEINVYYNRLDVLKMLSQRGILINICSKNDRGIIPEIEKILGDFMDYVTLKKINWIDKSQNIIDVANELNIGIDSLAFIDDNPFERDQVKMQLPQVLVLGDKQLIDILNMPEFDQVNITKESKKKRQMYRQQAKRMIDEKKYKTNKEEFLHSVNMKIWIREAEKTILDRVTELIQKTNQLNATTIRYTKQEILEFHKSDKHRIYAVNLYDKYGEYGMIGVGLIEEIDSTWHLNCFLFSCRAMGKTVEETLLAHIEKEAKEAGMRRIIGKFKKTDRNGPIENIFKNAGFVSHGTDDEEMEIWEYDLTEKEPSDYYDWFTIVTPEQITEN